MIDALECNPVNVCFGSASSFNIRATVYGKNIKGVSMSLEGPVSESRTEEKAPYAVFGDQNGNYIGKTFSAGTYTITAFAFNNRGDVSANQTYSFEIVDAPSESPSDQPSSSPTPKPTEAPTPAPVAPVAIPTPRPTQKPSSSPTDMPTALPTSQQTSAASATSAEPLTMRINSGGESFTDDAGNLWEADKYYLTGRTYETTDQRAINAFKTKKLYLSERWTDASHADLVYEIPGESLAAVNLVLRP